MGAVDRVFLFLLIIALCVVCMMGLKTRDQLERQIEWLEGRQVVQQATVDTLHSRLIDHAKRNTDSDKAQNDINKEIIRILNRSTSR